LTAAVHIRRILGSLWKNEVTRQHPFVPQNKAALESCESRITAVQSLRRTLLCCHIFARGLIPKSEVEYWFKVILPQRHREITEFTKQHHKVLQYFPKPLCSLCLCGKDR